MSNQNQKKNQQEIRWPKNEEIRGHEVRLVGKNVEQGIYLLGEALQLAQEQGLDLILINSKQQPAICKIGEYSKMVYEEKRRLKEMEKKSRESIIEMKEIRFTPTTASGDLDHMRKKAIKFLKDGNRVKLSMKFVGRQMSHIDIGKKLILEFATSIEEYGQVESLPQIQGKFMNIILKSKNIKN